MIFLISFCFTLYLWKKIHTHTFFYILDESHLSSWRYGTASYYEREDSGFESHIHVLDEIKVWRRFLTLNAMYRKLVRGF